MKVILASNNPGKIREFGELFKPFSIELVPQAELGISDAEETGLTFIENALIKARHAAKISGLPAIADDSGLSVSALNGAPGIYSARYAGKKANAGENIQKLLVALHGVPDDKRNASFHCVLAFLAHADDPTPLVSDGRWPGFILQAPQGEHGFGYDPVFYVPSEKKSAAELPAAVKNKISHRGIALRMLINHMTEKLHECTLR
jgi:XTP/dITP diphosphohydrolase